MDDLTSLLEEIRKRWPIARGTLAEVAKPCIRSTCTACERGEGHAAFNFTFRKDGKPRCLYVPRELVPALERALENGRRIEERMVELAEALILEHRQRRTAKAGGSTGRKRRT
jgi:hypothetical protein